MTTAPAEPPRGATVSDSDWFEDWFGEEYLALYEHRDQGEARDVVRLIADQIGEVGEAPVLDLACGAGRHQRTLSERGWWAVGLDLSPSLLRTARGDDPAAPLVRADMRALPFAPQVFDLVVNLFTSFGYFRDDAQHLRVISEVARVTRPGGWFVLDYLNAEHVRRTLVAYDVRVIGSVAVEQERAISPDGRFVSKTITLVDLGRTFVERVRLFEPDELSALCSSAGFDVAAVFGDYAGTPLRATSPRTIVFARRR